MYWAAETLSFAGSAHFQLQVYWNQSLGENPDRCKELAAAFGTQGIRAGDYIAEYIGEVIPFDHTKYLLEKGRKYVRWLHLLRRFWTSLNGCPTNLQNMAQLDGLAAISNHAQTEDEENAEMVVLQDYVSPITHSSPVVLLKAIKFIPPSQEGGEKGPVLSNIRWKYPKDAYAMHHLNSDSSDDNENDTCNNDDCEAGTTGQDIPTTMHLLTHTPTLGVML